MSLITSIDTGYPFRGILGSAVEYYKRAWNTLSADTRCNMLLEWMKFKGAVN